MFFFCLHRLCCYNSCCSLQSLWQINRPTQECDWAAVVIYVSSLALRFSFAPVELHNQLCLSARAVAGPRTSRRMESARGQRIRRNDVLEQCNKTRRSVFRGLDFKPVSVGNADKLKLCIFLFWNRLAGVSSCLATWPQMARLGRRRDCFALSLSMREKKTTEIWRRCADGLER